ncbi:flagellar hook-basal body protein FliE [Methylobacterium radiotolerans]|jgi:flagellar hook-basal body complex protein FliE|uniref:flagellar hook-basal body complex protein FliE n=1 Tax=Methylobacterium TaxID=407 RepID=UPI0004673BA9|nr:MULTISPECIES: flagellar hook-basal body complex protein FliE [Methylobacterium]KIU36151.1 flagellar hook-basal body protein FliE [Methylobacterium radiotolerans]KTS12319.1 flagellar hook-basal body protein FliE [Methylobacterium radiotolerans]KTS44222.1 flagellar hook-basal body protein FliE [Methylobacterium radiotolerans]KZC02599.1 Flagellar hook-basal body complex protein FliE [Methylobacterium radiotolerans]MDE3748758.1 flagellar hook-basal body complex protein FliE [Methylobacterium ra
MIQSLAALASTSDKNAVFGASELGLAMPGIRQTSPAAAASGFGDLLMQIAGQMRDTVKTGEAAAISGIQGKASTQAVVEAVMSAEQSLQTAVAIRDKVVAAYLEIVRMAI